MQFSLSPDSSKTKSSVDYDILNPWKRRRTLSDGVDPATPWEGFGVIYKNERKQIFFDLDIDLNTKISVLKVSPSVVGLVSRSGGQEVFWCSGVIFQSFWKNDSFSSLVFTSATLLRPSRSEISNTIVHLPTTFNSPSDIPSDWKPENDEEYFTVDETIDVYVAGVVYKGQVVISDFHYNIAILKFQSDKQLPCAVLRPLDLSFDFTTPINTTNVGSCLRLIPGDDVIALGRYTEKPYEIMVARGKYRSEDLDKIEILGASCNITKCGIGGPLISCKGEVIGINFYAEDYTPFLPINIFSLWWSNFNATRSSRRPWIGIEAANFYHTNKLGFFLRVWKLGISQGVLVNKVSPGSPAEISDLRQGDVIIKCHGITVKSTLQFFELIWNLAGKEVEAVVVREDSFQHVNIKVKDITSADEFYQWRLRRAYCAVVRSF